MNFNPFEISCPVVPKSTSANFITPIILIMVIGFMILSTTVSVNDINYDPVVIGSPVNEILDYKHKKYPREGVTRLVKGKVEIIHHGIKKDSVIMVSRKNIEGKPGQYLVIENIVSNESFEIRSVSAENELQSEDYSEIYFIIN